jgi:hypothetical protein
VLELLLELVSGLRLRLGLNLGEIRVKNRVREGSRTGLFFVFSIATKSSTSFCEVSVSDSVKC